MKTRRARKAAQPELKLTPERKPHPGSVWLRALTYASRWYIRVRLGKRVVVRVAGGAQSEAGAREFLECFKSEFARTGRIPAGKRLKREPQQTPQIRFAEGTAPLFPSSVP